MKRILLGLWLAFTPSGGADSLLGSCKTDLYALRPLLPGELVTVVISDRVSTNQSVSLQNSSRSDVDLPLGTGLIKLLVGGNLKSEGEIQRQEAATSTSEFQYTVTAKVVALEPGNVVILEAKNSVELDGKVRELELRGRVRRQDIGMDNMVNSDRLADAQVTVDGAKASPTGGGFGIFDFLLAPFR